MMATGGHVVVAPNGGNIEYLKDGENCLMYPQGDLEKAVQAIERISTDQELREHLYEEGIETVKRREWEGIEDLVAKAYFI